MKETVMKCGHTANSYKLTKDKKIPYCVICNCFEIAEKPSLEGRMARCHYCGRKTSSSWDLPFFQYNENSYEDEYYDGCFGWD